MREVGHLGENTFSFWCSQTDLYCNNSKSIDKTSWDFIVELPSSTDNSVNEIHKSPFECKVQVKASDGKKNSWSIKLSNLKRLCTSVLPTFIVLIKYEKKDYPIAAFVRHVDEELTTEVLAKIHKLEQEKKDIQLHKIQHSINFNNAHKLNELNGHSLKLTFLSYVGLDINQYVKKKELHLSSTGFEHGNALIRFRLKDKNQLENLVDSLLGNKKEVNIQDLSITNQRFGIPCKKTLKMINAATLHVADVKQFEPIVIKYRHDDFSASIKFDAKLYQNPLYESLPTDLRKFRIESDFFDIEIYPDKKIAEYTFYFERITKLEVRKFLNFLTYYNSLTTKNHLPTLEISRQNGVNISFNIMPIEEDFDFSGKIKTLKSIIGICNHFNIYEDIEISYQDLSSLERRVEEFDLMLKSRNSYFIVENQNSLFDKTKENIHICFLVVRVGDFFMAEIVSFRGKGVFEGSSIIVSEPEMTFEKQVILKVDEHFDIIKTKESLFEYSREIASKYADEYNVSLPES